MQLYGEVSRRMRFVELDKPNALPLPNSHFAITDVKYDIGVLPNYHIRYDDHYYSVPSQIAREKVDVYLIGSTLEVYHDNVHVCRHLKQPPNFQYTTTDEHMPSNHKIVRGWSPQWLVSRAEIIGPSTKEAATMILKKRNHPQQRFNSVMGLLNLAKTYTSQCLEMASQRAIRYHCVSYRSIKTILEQSLDKVEKVEKTDKPIISDHVNLRGPQYFSQQQKQVNE